MSNKNKEKALREAERKEQDFEKLLQFSKKRFKKFDEVIESIYLGENLPVNSRDKRIEVIRECFDKLKGKQKQNDRLVLKDALIQLDRGSGLVKEEAYIMAVFNMVLQRAYWKRTLACWKPSSKCVKRQLNDLAYYLFCDFAVPEFLYTSFFDNSFSRYLDWFIHIGTGRKLKELPGMPIPFTQRAGHYFLQAPAKYRIAEALRWAQAKGMNANDRLAERIAYSWLATKSFDDELFWDGFIRLIVNAGMFNYNELGGIIDYVREQRRENRSYSLKGRTLQSLLRQSQEWHKAVIPLRGNVFWDPSGLFGYKFQKKHETVLMEELTGSKLLANEGKAMRHCVGSYVPQCASKRIAIFSLRKYSMDVWIETLATIEVNIPIKRVVQAKAKMNRKICEEARKHLQGWADKNNLSISPHL